MNMLSIYRTFSFIFSLCFQRRSKSGAVELGLSSSKGSGLCLTAELQQYSLRGEEENVLEPRLRKKTINEISPYTPKFIIGDDENEQEEVKDTLTNLKSYDLFVDKKSQLPLAEELHSKLTEIVEKNEQPQLGLLAKVQHLFTRTVPATPSSSVSTSPRPLRKTSTPATPLGSCAD